MFYIEVICHLHAINSLEIIIAELDGRLRVSGLPLNDKCSLWIPHTSVSVQVSNSHVRSVNARKPERQVSRMVVMMIVAFMVAWTPYALFSIIVTVYPTIYLDPILAAVPAFFAKTAAVYNPIIYVFMNQQVWKKLNILAF